MRLEIIVWGIQSIKLGSLTDSAIDRRHIDAVFGSFEIGNIAVQLPGEKSAARVNSQIFLGGQISQFTCKSEVTLDFSQGASGNIAETDVIQEMITPMTFGDICGNTLRRSL